MKTFRLHLLKKKKNHSHISAFIRFVVSPTPSSSENTTSNSNNDPRPFKSPLAGVPTQKTAGAVSQGERRFCRQTQRVTGPLQRVAGPSLHQRESLGWRAASQAQGTRPRPPVALQIIFPYLLWACRFSATQCSVNCHTEVSEQLSINSCRAQLTQAEHSKAGLLLIPLVMHRIE